MPIIELFIYSGIFLGIYFAFFVYTTFLISYTRSCLKEKWFFPRVSLIIPCYNEAKNIEKTLKSLLALDYPLKKVRIMVVDDGSEDNTLKKAKQFAAANSNVDIRVFHKKNGGKHTALNLAIQKTPDPFIATVDADSWLQPQALKKAMLFFKNKQVKAVIGTVKIEKPKNITEGIQSVEFLMAAFIRKVFSLVDSINVTPGPLSIFRREVFQKLGPYRKGHQTEDLEMAFRLQKANFKIAHAVDAVVFTEPCNTLKSLFKQRLRWRRGFLLNLYDYPEMLNIKKHGSLSFLMWYSILGSIISVVIAGYTAWKIVSGLYHNIYNLTLVGIEVPNFASIKSIDGFSFAFTPTLILGAATIGAILGYLLLSKYLTKESHSLKKQVPIYLAAYPFLNACWWIMAGLSILVKKELQWR